MVTLSVLLSAGQCIHRVMRLVVLGGYERCMTYCLREQYSGDFAFFSINIICC